MGCSKKKKKERDGNLSFRRSMFGSCPQVGKHRLSSISVTGKALPSDLNNYHMRESKDCKDLKSLASCRCCIPVSYCLDVMYLPHSPNFVWF